MSTNIPTVTSPPWSLTTKRLVVLILTGVLVLMGRQVSASAWTSIVIALVLAYLLSPLVSFFERHMTVIKGYEARRTLAVLQTWIVVGGALGLVLGLVVPATIGQMRQFAEDLPGLVESTQNDLEELLSRPIHLGNFTIVPWEEIQSSINPPTDGTSATTDNSLTTRLQDAILSAAESGITVVGGAVSFVFSMFIVLVMLYYLMRDGPLFVAYLTEVIPESYRGDMLRLLHELGLIWNAYLRGQMLLNLSIGVATYIAALILGLPQPLLLAMIAGFLELIPNIGPAIAAVPAVALAFTADSTTFPGLHAGFTFAAATLIAYVSIQQLEAIFLVPRILGSSLDLHPLVVLLAILIGAGIAGILGVILAAPSAATLRLVGRYLRGKLLDEELFPPLPPYAAQQRGFIYRLIRYFLSRRFPVIPTDGLAERPAAADRQSTESASASR